VRACTLDDLLDLEQLSDPQSSADGDRVAVVVTRRDAGEDRDAMHVEAVDLATGERHRLTQGPSDRSPRRNASHRPSGDQRGEDGPAQVWLLPTAGGEPHRLTEFPLGVSELTWSPDGQCLAVAAPAVPDDHEPSNPVVVTRLVSKMDGTGRLGPLTVHAHMIPVDGGESTPLTSGDLVVRGLAWAPAGDQLALVTARHDERDLDGVAHVFTVAAAGGELQQVTEWSGTATAPTWSPDGGTIVFAGSAMPLASGHTRLWRVDAAGGKPEELAPDLDRNVMVGGPGYPGAAPRVTPDATVRFCVRDRGAVHLVAVPLAGGGVRTLLGGERTVSGVAHEPLVCLVSDVRSTPDLHVVDEDGPRRVLRTNAAFFDEVEVAEPVSRTFTAPDGLAVHGWVAGARDGAPQPLLLDVHGGPHNAWGPSFDPVHAYSQLLAAEGWVVLTVNPRGSDGYGEDFWTAARGSWGLADAGDFLSAVDELVADGTADPDRLAVTGYSYGGYMTCWLTTQTDRFAAAVPGGVVVDLVSFCGTADVGGLFDVSEFGTTAVGNPALLRRISPLTHVDAVRTPTLIVQGESDDRCPVGQAEQWFTALRTLGREVEMVLYPEASHLFILAGRPSHRADWSRRVVDWVMRHTTR
jgi:dipeptidyl aminopeptidase/acylaminoacyl peptidase